MAIKIEKISGWAGVSPTVQVVGICADSEDDIKNLPAFGEVVEDVDGGKVIPAKLSTAYTADGAIGYKLSPSGVWTKFKG